MNLLRQANVNPNISAHAYINGLFNYDAHPLAPLRVAVQVNEKPHQRKSWADHSIDGWYLGAAMEHYRCHAIFVKKTRAECISDTVFFKHRCIMQPSLTPEDIITKALQDITTALKRKSNIKNTKQFHALKEIDKLFPSQGEQSKAENTMTKDALNNQPTKTIHKSHNRAPLSMKTDEQLPRVGFPRLIYRHTGESRGGFNT